jgi:hypothetical protein
MGNSNRLANSKTVILFPSSIIRLLGDTELAAYITHLANGINRAQGKDDLLF